MREFLLTKFVCARCGNNLKLTYDIPKNAGTYSPGEPTGADMVASLIAIIPCHCEIKPLEQMRAAIKAMIDDPQKFYD